MRIREPKTTALIFASGKMVVTGAKSEDDSKLASRKYARIIQKLGFNAKFTDFKIQNIVGSCDIKFPIRLEGLASKHHNFSSYEPELFPGLIYRMIKPKIVLLIFVSGKIVLTGAKVREEIYQAFEMIYPVLQGQSLPLLVSVSVDYGVNTLQISARFKLAMLAVTGRLPHPRPLVNYSVLVGNIVQLLPGTIITTTTHIPSLKSTADSVLARHHHDRYSITRVASTIGRLYHFS